MSRRDREMSQQRYHLYVDRMTCTNCAGIISKALTGLAGIISLKAVPEERLIDVLLDTDRTSLDEIRQCIEKQGYEVRRIETA
ncbi:MAG: heavy-metal-associated domain-containing protein [Candidatus Sumerlaeaceae bacterium]|nr:heavy-metal-associated domain-containing protein [Candidatus Sumerlaeaceae bacterium]